VPIINGNRNLISRAGQAKLGNEQSHIKIENKVLAESQIPLSICSRSPLMPTQPLAVLFHTPLLSERPPQMHKTFIKVLLPAKKVNNCKRISYN